MHIDTQILKNYINEEIRKIEGDTRYQDDPANVMVNAPLAIIQIELKSRMSELIQFRDLIEANEQIPSRETPTTHEYHRACVLWHRFWDPEADEEHSIREDIEDIAQDFAGYRRYLFDLHGIEVPNGEKGE